MEDGQIGSEWLTYQAAGTQLGISAEAVRQRARRLCWRHQRGNDGRTLILVPETVMLGEAVQAVQLSGQSPVHTDGQTAVQPVQNGEVAALQALIEVLRDQLAKAENRATEDRQQARIERERAAAAEDQKRELRHLLDTEMAELSASLTAAREAPTPPSHRPEVRPAKARGAFWRRWL